MPVASPAVQIVDIPLAKIRPNPKNPGPPITEEQIAELAENLEAEGLLNPVKVMPDPEKGEGYWLILAGERRYRAYLHLKRETIPAFLLNPTLAEAVKITHLDNAVRERGWWADYQSIENLRQADPSLNQRQLSAQLEIALPKVNRALGMLPLLNPAARALLVTHGNNGSKGNKGISERAASQLADLKDPDKVEAGLRRILNENMTEAQVRQMVATLKNGGVSSVSKSKPSPLAGEGGVRGAVSPVATPTPAPEPKATQTSGDGLKELAMSGAAGALGGFLAANLKRALGTLVRRYMLHALAALGVLAFLGFHGVGNLFKPQTYTAVPETTKPSPLVPGDLKGTQGQLPVSGARETGRVRGDSVSVPVQAPAKVRVSKPSPPAGEGRVRGASVPSVPSSTGLPKWAPEGLPLVKDFASRFYNRSYPSWEGDQDYLKARMTTDYGPVFLKQYYPPTQRVELRDKQEVQAFSNAQAPVVVGGAGNSAQYRVQGQLTLQNRSGKLFKNVWTKPVALEISVRHEEGIGNWVEKVTEVTPVPVQKAENGADPLKAVQDAAGAVSNVADGVAKVDGVKKILGL